MTTTQNIKAQRKGRRGGGGGWGGGLRQKAYVIELKMANVGEGGGGKREGESSLCFLYIISRTQNGKPTPPPLPPPVSRIHAIPTFPLILHTASVVCDSYFLVHSIFFSPILFQRKWTRAVSSKQDCSCDWVKHRSFSLTPPSLQCEWSLSTVFSSHAPPLPPTNLPHPSAVTQATGP